MLRAGRQRHVPRRQDGVLPSGLVRHDCSGRIRLEIDADTLDADAVERATGIAVHPTARFAATALLWPDGESPYDSLAIGIWIEGVRVGWLTHADSAAISAVVRSLADADLVLECGALLEGIPAGRAARLGGWVTFDPDGARAALDERVVGGSPARAGRFVSPT
jgi:hypothetical protein